jgi:hypothetical protein
MFGEPGCRRHPCAVQLALTQEMLHHQGTPVFMFRDFKSWLGSTFEKPDLYRSVILITSSVHTAQGGHTILWRGLEFDPLFLTPFSFYRLRGVRI